MRSLAVALVLAASCPAASAANAEFWGFGRKQQTYPPEAFKWIRDIAASSGGKFVLEAKTYLIDQQYQLPANTEIHGTVSGDTRTVVKAVGKGFWHMCGRKAGNRKGFLLGDNTYIGKLHFIGMDDRRMCDNQLLCGGAPFETPGCRGTGRFEEAPESCDGDLGIGRGIQNATVEDITIAPLTVQSIFYATPTRRGVPVSRDVTIRKVVCHGTWADGLNIHGGHQNILVEDCDVRNTGDDVYAIWSVGIPGADNITFQRNVAANPWFRPGCFWFKHGSRNSNYCFALYGGKGSKIINSTCTGAKYVVSYGNILHALYGGTFTEESNTLVRGVRGMAGYPCYFGVPFKGKVIECTADGYVD